MSDQRTGIREAFVALVSVFSVLGAPTLAADGSGANLPESFFTERVAPILEEHCVECHGTEKQKNGLRLDRVEGVVRGGDSGEPLLKAGDPEGSYLIRRVLSNDPKDRMPPKGDRVSEGEIEILRRWIAAGGRMPGAERIASEQRIKTDHWSFQPVRRVENGKQGAAVIDALIEQRLAEKGLARSPRADRRTFIRRLFLVIHGLPPTAEEVEAFVADPSENAHERLVDRVLASPRFGERWARHWMDVVRYADTDGFERNVERKTAYPYRDYLVESFNQDKPYDVFIREQIAGDMLGCDAATGFLVAGPFDSVKSQDKNLVEMQRQEELADMVNTTGTAVMGLTLGCARCHNHKFDPIPQKDYYAIQAVFAGVLHGERPLREKMTPEREADIAAARRESASKTARLNELRTKAQGIASSKVQKGSGSPGREGRASVTAKWNEDRFDAVETSAVRFTVHRSNGGAPCLDELEVFTSEGRNAALISEGGKASASGTIPGYAIHRIEHLNDGKYGNAHSWICDGPTGWVRVDFPKLERIDRIVWSRARDGGFGDRVPLEYVVEVLGKDAQWRKVSDHTGRAPFQGDKGVTLGKGDAALASLSQDDLQEANRLKKEIEGLTARLAEMEGNARVGRFTAAPARTRRLYRGEPGQPREEVAPGGLSVLSAPVLGMDEPDAQRRLKFAEWMTSKDNPLTARVMVNRVWHYVFGTGIVDTPSDFGANGGRPTHPELLDWMADEFVRSGWSVKHVLRLVLNTETFRQDSAPVEAALAKDADGRFLWRFTPRRLEAEAIRDSILATAGSIDLSMGGPGFPLLDVVLENVRHYFPKESFSEKEFRRMVYMFRVRAAQDGVFGAFDCPDGGSVMARRSRSNTPLQALNLFNSNFVMQQAELLAERLKGLPTPQSQVQSAFGRFFAREPDSFELEASVAMVKKEGLVAFTRALFNTSEFLFVF
ncbi:MAG: hypothetical protein RIS92_1774 [Verrucomicrobiota bacterium]|jgi:hypothetical protein